MIPYSDCFASVRPTHLYFRCRIRSLTAYASAAAANDSSFRLDLQARALYRAGIRIRLAPQPYQLLAALVEQPGSILSREALQQRLWPETFVDYEHGLNKTVRKLREALGDSAESPRYIETVQKAGYRFIAPVIQGDNLPSASPITADLSPVVQPLPSQDLPQRSQTSPRRWKVLAVVAASIASMAVAATLFLQRNSYSRNPSALASQSADTQAEDLYRHGRYLWSEEHALEASDYFKQSIELQPGFGPGWAGLSMYYGAALIRGRLDPAGGLRLLDETSAKALRFAPNMPEAHLAACGSLFLNTWSYQIANKECNRALQLDPSDGEVYHFQSKMLAAVGREQDAVEIQRISSRLDSLSKPWALSQALMQARRYDESFAEARSRLEEFPHDSRLLNLLADVSLYRGNDSQYADYLEQSFRSDGDESSAAQIRDAYRSGGVGALARWRLERLQKQSRTGYVSPFRMALAYIDAGDREHAIVQLAIALDRHAPDLLWMRCYPEFEVLTSDVRYRRILQQLPH